MAHLLLDVNQTLSDLSPVGAVLDRHGATPGLVDTWFASVLRDGFALSAHGAAPPFADLARDVLVRALTGEPSLDGAPAEVADEAMTAMGSLDVQDDVPDGLRALAEAGHRLTPFSNGATASTRGLLDRAGLLDLVDGVLSVEELPVWKPHPDAYAFALDTLGLSPAEAVMVAVHPWDVDGAARAGMRTALVERDDRPAPAAFRTPTWRVRSFADLAGALGAG